MKNHKKNNPTIDVAPSQEVPAEALQSPVDPTSGDETSVFKKLTTITDFVSGRQVRATPEEIEAVQVFSKRLVEDLGYPKSYVQTRPQYRVRATPSGDSKFKSYPIDIAVFSSTKKLESDVSIIVECKKKTRKDG